MTAQLRTETRSALDALHRVLETPAEGHTARTDSGVAAETEENRARIARLENAAAYPARRGTTTVWEYHEGKTSDQLLVFVHGYAREPKDYTGLLAAFSELYRSDICIVHYDAAPLSRKTPEEVAHEVLMQIDAVAGRYKSLHLCGHSFGCVFLRQAILEALSQEPPRSLAMSLNGIPIDGAANNIRLTLLAFANRGWQPVKFLHRVALEIVFRWPWLLALTIALCGCIRIAWKSLEPLMRLFGAASAEAIIVGVLASWYGLWRERATDRRLLPLPFLIGIWLAWAFDAFVDFELRLSAIVGMMLAATAVGVGWLARSAGYRPFGILIVTSLVVAAAAFVGFVFDSAPWIAWPCILALLLFAVLAPVRTGLLLERMLRDSASLTKLRLDWIERKEDLARVRPIVHLFGSQDKMVDAFDNIEMYASGNFVQLKIQGAGHGHFTFTDSTGGQRNPFNGILGEAMAAGLIRGCNIGIEPHNELRMKKPDGGFVEWIDRDNVMRRSERRNSASGVAAAPAKPKHVVFLIHGIRDFADWQFYLSDRIKAKAEASDAGSVEIVSVRYGYFSVLQFLLSEERDRATRAFRDLYVQNRVRWPSAKFHVAAHSNGTFVTARSLAEAYVRFDRVYLCGSVVRCDFEWGEHLAAGRIQAIRSDRATQDWPVGVLCWTLGLPNRLPGARDWSPYGLLGAGGVLGFDDAPRWPERFAETTLVGDHGAALNPQHHEEIADFLLSERVRPADPHAAWPQPDRQLLNRILGLTVFASAVLVLVFVLSALWAPSVIGWGIVVGSLLTWLVLRTAMAI